MLELAGALAQTNAVAELADNLQMHNSDRAEFPFANPCAVFIIRPVRAFKLILDPRPAAILQVLYAVFALEDFPFAVDHCHDPDFDTVSPPECSSSLCCVSHVTIAECLVIYLGCIEIHFST